MACFFSLFVYGCRIRILQKSVAMKPASRQQIHSQKHTADSCRTVYETGIDGNEIRRDSRPRMGPRGSLRLLFLLCQENACCCFANIQQRFIRVYQI